MRACYDTVFVTILAAPRMHGEAYHDGAGRLARSQLKGTTISRPGLSMRTFALFVHRSSRLLHAYYSRCDVREQTRVPMLADVMSEDSEPAPPVDVVHEVCGPPPAHSHTILPPPPSYVIALWRCRPFPSPPIPPVSVIAP